MAKLNLTIPILAAALVAGGCAQQLGPLLGQVGVDPGKAVEVEDKVLGTAVKPVAVYCAGAPALARATLRSRINAQPELAGHEIGVWCVGDPPLTLGGAAPEAAPEPAAKPAG